MLSGWWKNLLDGIVTVNQILTAGIAITAFSLFLYSLSFNLRDRVARAFSIILICIIIIYTAEALQSSATTESAIDLFLRLEWLGIIFLPSSYIQLSNGLLVASGVVIRKKQHFINYLAYSISCIFIVLLAGGYLVGTLVISDQPAPYLERTGWTEIFTGYYLSAMIYAWINIIRAYKSTLTKLGRRRILYLLTGATAPALGSFPYLLYGSEVAGQHLLIFWGVATSANIAMGGLIVIMAYAVAFYGVSWPDRVIKTRLVKWIMRGPVATSLALGAMTIVRRIGEYFGIVYSAAVPVTMVFFILLMEHAITLFAPLWEKILYLGGDRSDISLLQSLEDHLITQSDLRQFLDAVLAAVRDRLNSNTAFIAALDNGNLSMVVSAGNPPLPVEADLEHIIPLTLDSINNIYSWGDYWIFPLLSTSQPENESETILGILGVKRQLSDELMQEQRQAMEILIQRAAQALTDRRLQHRVFRGLEELKPEAELIQRWRAAGSYDSKSGMLADSLSNPSSLIELVREALTHYWGGPKLTQSPLLDLKIVRQAAINNSDTPANALRYILRKSIDAVRPQGERRFTAEWILFNILEMKFIEGRKVRDVANKLSMSEADLYRKQRVAIEELTRVISAMEIESDEK